MTAAYPVEIYGHGRARPARTGTPLSLAFALALARQRLGLAMKQGLDLVIAAFLLLALAPILAAIALLIRADGGPALFRHKPLGANDRAFPCLKFRSMRVDADAVLADILATDQQAAAEWEAVRKLRDDPRVTRIGRFLRKTSLDELPQLINVLRREMSLVGPRPIVEAEKAFYGRDFEYYNRARPGMTGLWQVSGRSDTSYASRVALDVWYVRNRSFWRDLVILAQTVPAVMERRGAV